MNEGQNIEPSQEEENVNDSTLQEQTIESTETTNPKSEIPTSEIKNMEVHHHPNLHHRRKHWKEYLLEGLMIFIAVTLGFFAESYREYLSDRSKEKEYMISMIEDIKEDTTKINDLYAIHATQAKAYDKIWSILEKPLKHDSSYLLEFYNAAYGTLGSFAVTFGDRTLTQLKSGANFRLVRNNLVSDSIINYSDGITDCNEQAKFIDRSMDAAINTIGHLVNMKVFRNYPLINTSIDIVSSDPKIILDYSNALYLKATVENYYMNQLKIQKLKGTRLIKLIQKKYHLQ